MYVYVENIIPKGQAKKIAASKTKSTTYLKYTVLSAVVVWLDIEC